MDKKNDEIKKYNEIIKNIEEKLIINSEENSLICDEKYTKMVKEKCSNNNILKPYLSSIVNISKKGIKLKLLSNENYIEKCRKTLWLIMVITYCENNNLDIETLLNSNLAIENTESRMFKGFCDLIKEKIKQIEKEKNEVLNELSMDDELLFELGLIKCMASKYSEYNKDDFEYLKEFENKYDTIIEKYI